MGREDVLNATSTIVREYSWPPHVFEGMYLDDQDEQGLIYWYDDVVEVIKEREKQGKKGERGQ